MSFTSTFFIFLFLPIAVLLYWVLDDRFKNAFLLAVSMLFYASCNVKMLPLLIVSMAVNYVFGLILGKVRKKRIVSLIFCILMLAFNFSLLFYFKYYIFTVTQINYVFNANLIIPEIALPLGISFYTFRTVSYCLDVMWGGTESQKSPIVFALYVSFFPHILSGPIARYNDFNNQLKDKKFCITTCADGIKRIIIGIFKKVVFANTIGIIVDRIVQMPNENRTVLLAWIGAVGYMLQLYYDFSGYTDIAIGVGKMFGIETAENFDHPYASTTITEYWSRWHITLGTWLRDYIYTPVFRAFSSKENSSIHVADIAALFLTWLFAGIWHGAAWHYVVYGLFYFLFIVIERTLEFQAKKRRKRLKIKKKPRTVGQIIALHFYCLIVVLFGTLLFRVDSLPAYVGYLRSMFSGQIVSELSFFILKDVWLMFFFAGYFSMPIVPFIRKKVNAIKNVFLYHTSQVMIIVCYVLIFIVDISAMLNTSYNPFLYFDF